MSSRQVTTKTEEHRNSDGTVTVTTRTEEIIDGVRKVTENTSTITPVSTVQATEPSNRRRSSFFDRFFGRFNRHRGENNNADSEQLHSPKAVKQKKCGSSGLIGIKGTPSIKECRKQMLKQHNHYRTKHGAKALKIDEQMNSYAQEWADYLARSNRLQHRTERKYGENVFMAMDSSGIDLEMPVQSWYDEMTNYNFDNGKYSSGCGHFTQIVWKSSAKLGLGIAESNSGCVFVVANYDPPGNVLSKFAENVEPLKG